MKNWVIGTILVLAAVAAYYYFNVYQPAASAELTKTQVVVEKPASESRKPPVSSVSTPPPQPDLQPEPQAPVTPEAEAIPLPVLAESDPLALTYLEGMLGEPAVVRYVVSDNVISRVVATIDMLASGQVPGVVQAVDGPGSDFEVIANESPETVIRNEVGDPIPQFLMDSSNFDRYTPYVDTLEATSAARLVEVYGEMYPLFQEAFSQMGYADGDFNARLIEIIDLMLATPEVEEPLELIKPEAVFLFADPDLEALPAGQKVLLRMGPENAARVKAKLAEIRAIL